MDRRQVYGGPSPPSISQARSLCTRCTRGWSARGLFPCFSRGSAPAGGELAASLLWQRWCPIGEGKSFLSLWRLRRWVKVAVKASQGAGHGERRLELHRRAGMVRVLRHRPILWCVWATLCSSGHVGQVEGSSRTSSGFGHGGVLPSTTAASVRWLRSR